MYVMSCYSNCPRLLVGVYINKFLFFKNIVRYKKGGGDYIKHTQITHYTIMYNQYTVNIHLVISSC